MDGGIDVLWLGSEDVLAVVCFFAWCAGAETVKAPYLVVIQSAAGGVGGVVAFGFFAADLVPRYGAPHCGDEDLGGFDLIRERKG